MRILLKSIVAILTVTFATISSAKVIRVPTEQSSIQAAIDVATSGDTVLVDVGRYLENISIRNKNIVLGSLFLTTGDATYISRTIIDGRSLSNSVRIRGVDSTTVLTGFTITNGSGSWGGGIFCSSSDPKLENLFVTKNRSTVSFGDGGGGIALQASSAQLKNVEIVENEAKAGGGGISINRGVPRFQNVTINNNTAGIHGGGLYIVDAAPLFDRQNRSNIYSNLAGNGSDLYEKLSPGISVFVDTFTVIFPTDYHAFPVQDFDFDILNAKLEQLDGDIYVSPEGDDKNSGLTLSEPLGSISSALCRIRADENNQRIVYLSDGRYSYSTTREHFPLNLVNNVTLSGQSRVRVIIDAEGQNGVMLLFSDNGITLKNLTISGGFSLQGGGINCDNSNLRLENVLIAENNAEAGGAIFCNESQPVLQFVTITQNDAEEGGGIYCRNSKPKVAHVTITKNRANYGGGILCIDSGKPTLTNTILWNNSPQEIYFSDLIGSNSITISFSDVQGGQNRIVTNNSGAINWQNGNIDADPLFVDAPNDLRLQWGSPVIDAGDPNTELDLDGTRADMGAFPFDQSQFIEDFALLPNYPNPFNSSTTIQYELPEETHVKITIHNVLGQTVETLVDKIQHAGFRMVTWNGTDKSNRLVSSGLYIYTLIVNEKRITRKMTLLK